MNNIVEKEYFDVAVVGGGAAGMMAAISASSAGARVVLIEKNKSLGKKLLLTGNGRCNITQANLDIKEFIAKLGKNGKFLFSSFSVFGSNETQEFFEKFGLKIKIEKDGRVFPVSNLSQDVLDVLERVLKKNKVKIVFNQKVLGFGIKDKKVEYIELANAKIYAENFILTTGGKSYPATGSSGDGYEWLEKIGHTIILPAPALTPIKIKEAWIKELQGISLKNVGINLIQNNQKIKIESGEIIFTHFGLSGPAIINASKAIGDYLKKGEVILEIDLLPAINILALEEKVKIDFEKNKKRNFKNYLVEIFPQKLVYILLKLSEIEKDRKIYSLNKSERLTLVRVIKSLSTTVESLLDFNHAMITSGGVSLKEVDPKTMHSKIINNLFFAGEILDLDGPTGGFNLQIAWTTGFVAGTSFSQAH